MMPGGGLSGGLSGGELLGDLVPVVRRTAEFRGQRFALPRMTAAGGDAEPVRERFPQAAIGPPDLRGEFALPLKAGQLRDRVRDCAADGQDAEPRPVQELEMRVIGADLPPIGCTPKSFSRTLVSWKRTTARSESFGSHVSKSCLTS
jgi:hypothetical protein